MESSRPILFVFAIIFLSVGIFSIVHAYNKSNRCTEETVCEVIRFVKKEVDDDANRGKQDKEYRYYPVIRYKAGNREITIETTTSGYSTEPTNLREMTIYYNPDNPEEFVYDRGFDIFGLILPGLSILAGLVFLIGGIFNWKVEEVK